MSFSSATATVIKIGFTGAAAPGPVSVPGLQKGDVLIVLAPTGFEYGFETVVSVNDELQQTTPFDWSSVGFTGYLLRGV